MDFIEYRSIVEEKLRRKNINSGINLDSLFDSYINNTDPSTYVKNYLGVLSEKTNMDKRFNRYLSEIISMVRKYGYNIIKMPKELNENIEELYNDGYSTSECANYLVEELDKNAVKIDNEKKPDDLMIYNKLLVMLHGIDDVALKDVDISGNDLYAILRIKLFDLRNELNTDVKSYLASIDKYFRPYVKQNVDNGNRVEITGYTVSQKSVFCTVKLKIDLLDTDDSESGTFSLKETANIIKMYVNIFKTFGEQNTNLI